MASALSTDRREQDWKQGAKEKHFAVFRQGGLEKHGCILKVEPIGFPVKLSVKE